MSLIESFLWVSAGVFWFGVLLYLARKYLRVDWIEEERINSDGELDRQSTPHITRNPHNAATNDILKAMAKNIENSASEKLAQYLVARPPMYQIGPAERIVTIPKDVWAELQAMPNDGSWSTRQLVRAIQRANKKKRGAP